MPMHGIGVQCPKHEDDYAMGAMPWLDAMVKMAWHEMLLQQLDQWVGSAWHEQGIKEPDKPVAMGTLTWRGLKHQ